MDLFPKNTLPTKEVKKFILIFYTIGVLGFLIPWTNHFFITITPYALLLSTYLLLLYHDNYSRKDVLVFSAIAFLGFFIEVAGVNTGIIFGHYLYGNALGLKLFNTPLLIALNWLFLTYTAFAISMKICKSEMLQLLIAPSIMLLYDIVLEQLAPKMDMWSWQYSVVPLQNYIAWWIIGFLFVGFIKICKIETKNPVAILLFMSQLLFFIMLFIVFKVIK
jgi:putative membrane protein